MDYVEKTGKSMKITRIYICKDTQIQYDIFKSVRGFLYVFNSFFVLYIDLIKYIVQQYEHRLHNAERIYENNVCVHVPKAKIYTACSLDQDCIQKSDQNQQIEYCCQSRL